MGYEMPEFKYVIVHTVEVNEKHMPKEAGAINGGIMNRNDKIKSLVITINVKSIYESIERIKKNGGKIVMDKFNVGEGEYLVTSETLKEIYLDFGRI